jgi:uncharacterized SAM-binding protein YcdF (DUF218 family)
MACLLLVLGAIVSTVFVVTYRSIAGWSVRDETRSADVMLVLGAAVWPDEQPGPALRARTERAIELYQDGYASSLILSGGLGRHPPEEAEVMRRLVVESGIPAEAIALEKQAHSTWESMVHTEVIMRQRGWETVLVVTDPFHMKRSLLMARDNGLAAYASPVLKGPTSDRLHRRLFYTSREVLALWWYLVQRSLSAI